MRAGSRGSVEKTRVSENRADRERREQDQEKRGAREPARPDTRSLPRKWTQPEPRSRCTEIRGCGPKRLAKGERGEGARPRGTSSPILAQRKGCVEPYAIERHDFDTEAAFVGAVSWLKLDLATDKERKQIPFRTASRNTFVNLPVARSDRLTVFAYQPVRVVGLWDSPTSFARAGKGTTCSRC